MSAHVLFSFFFCDAGSVTRTFGSKGVRSRLSGTNKKSKARFCLSFNIVPLPLFSSFFFLCSPFLLDPRFGAGR